MYSKAQYVDNNISDVVYASAVAVDTSKLNFQSIHLFLYFFICFLYYFIDDYSHASAPTVMGEIPTSQNFGCNAHYVAPPPTPMESVPILQPEILAPPMPGSLRRTIEIFENERFSPFSGFSTKGLLAMDRGGLSDADGNTR